MRLASSTARTGTWTRSATINCTSRSPATCVVIRSSAISTATGTMTWPRTTRPRTRSTSTPIAMAWPPILDNFDPPVAATSSVPQTNLVNPLDVNRDGSVSSIDALLVINQLNAGSQQSHAAAVSATPFLDVNGDKNVSSIDALLVIN